MACVVTEDQAKELDKKYKDKMPTGREDISKSDNTWARYENFGDTIYELTWNKVGRSWVIVKKEQKDLVEK